MDSTPKSGFRSTTTLCRSETFEILLKLPGLNEYTGSNRLNRYAGASMKRKTEDSIKVFIMQALREGRISKHNKTCELHFLWIEKNNRRDGDNIAFATKFIQDSLVACGVFPNDNRKYICGLYHDFEVRDYYGVEVTIKEK
jgi:hypothetical protein